MGGGEEPFAPKAPEDAQERFSKLARDLQEAITSKLQTFEEGAKFQEDEWSNDDKGATKKGRARVLKGGNVFESAGVNWSEVRGKNLPPSVLAKHPEVKGHPFFATGLSLVIHPASPHIPTVHLNIRYFEVRTPEKVVFWFGGGADLTPYILVEEQCVGFHRAMKGACDGTLQDSLYNVAKLWCDEYFYIKHRGEHRGIGGIFFDYLDGSPEKSMYGGTDAEGRAAEAGKQLEGGQQGLSWEDLIGLAERVTRAFLDFYAGQLASLVGKTHTEEQREWQLYRRGRYVEFNLVYDRGTLFGLQTGGRTESILMSLPPVCRFEYCYEIKPGSDAEKMVEPLRSARDWLGSSA